MTHLGPAQFAETAHDIGASLQNICIGSANNGGLDAIRFSSGATAYSDVTGATNLGVAAPTVVINPVNTITGNGSNFTFAATTTGSSLVYQWAFNGGNLAYGTGSSLTVTNASAATR